MPIYTDHLSVCISANYRYSVRLFAGLNIRKWLIIRELSDSLKKGKRDFERDYTAGQGCQ